MEKKEEEVEEKSEYEAIEASLEAKAYRAQGICDFDFYDNFDDDLL